MTIQEFEKSLYSSCQAMDCSDYHKYPLVTEEDFMIMEQAFSDGSRVYIFPFVRKNDCGTAFVDLYIWDVMFYPCSYRRFIIADGYSLSPEDEDCFLRYIHGSFEVPEEHMEPFNEKLADLIPQWHYEPYPVTKAGQAFDHIYWASHPSVKEILYKAGLNNIAYRLDQIPYNLIGTNPTTIIGLPFKFLRALNNDPALVTDLYSEAGIEDCRRVYETYGKYIGKEVSFNQIRYLNTLCHYGEFAGHGFNRKLYSYLELSVPGLVTEYEEFFERRNEVAKDVPDVVRKTPVPKPESLPGTIRRLRTIQYWLEDDYADELIRERKRHDELEYAGDRYMVVLPRTCSDFFREGLIQGNCLADALFIDDHAYGCSTIMFLRKRNQPDRPFVTLEVGEDRSIKQVYARQNTFPAKEVYRFLEEWARKKWLLYDPRRLITESPFFLRDSRHDHELEEYVEEFRKKNHLSDRLPDHQSMQLTLRDCFPETFGVTG